MSDWQRVPFRVAHRGLGAHDSALIAPHEETLPAFLEAVVQSVAIDIDITVAGVTMHLAGWQDPEHWAEEWGEVSGGEWEDVCEYVAGLLDAASEAGP